MGVQDVEALLADERDEVPELMDLVLSAPAEVELLDPGGNENLAHWGPEPTRRADIEVEAIGGQMREQSDGEPLRSAAIDERVDEMQHLQARTAAEQSRPS